MNLHYCINYCSDDDDPRGNPLVAGFQEDLASDDDIAPTPTITASGFSQQDAAAEISSDDEPLPARGRSPLQPSRPTNSVTTAAAVVLSPPLALKPEHNKNSTSPRVGDSTKRSPVPRSKAAAVKAPGNEQDSSDEETGPNVAVLGCVEDVSDDDSRGDGNRRPTSLAVNSTPEQVRKKWVLQLNSYLFSSV